MGITKKEYDKANRTLLQSLLMPGSISQEEIIIAKKVVAFYERREDFSNK